MSTGLIFYSVLCTLNDETLRVNDLTCKKDVKLISDNSSGINDLVMLVDYYNDELSAILDKHAPEQHHLVALRKPIP